MPAPRTAPTHAQEQADAREFEAFAQGQSALDIDAATWATRRRNGLDAQGQAELQAWLDADPRHGEALQDMEDTLGEVQQLPQDDVQRLKATLPAEGRLPARGASPEQRRPGGRWAWPWPQWQALALCLLLMCTLGGGWMGWSHWQTQPVFVQAYATARGQQQHLALPDGSTLHLDTATRLDARFYRQRREVHLMEGQARFEVQADAQRPFHVLAGGARITVVGTRFTVRHTRTGLDAGRTLVAVEEGHVRVTRAAQAADDTQVAALEQADLRAGLAVIIDAQGQWGPVGALAQVSPAAASGWQQGRLSFDQTPLAQVIAEFERYGPTHLVVRDPAVAALPVGGSYSVAHFSRFVETLPQVLPVRLVRRGEVTEVVAR